MLTLILLIAAFVLCAVEGLLMWPPRPNLGWLGMALFLLWLILGGAIGHIR